MAVSIRFVISIARCRGPKLGCIGQLNLCWIRGKRRSPEPWEVTASIAAGTRRGLGHEEHWLAYSGTDGWSSGAIDPSGLDQVHFSSISIRSLVS